MWMSLKEQELKFYINKQLNVFFPDGVEVNFSDEKYCMVLKDALERVENCFSHISVRNYSRVMEDGTETTAFYHLNMDQWSTFLYFFANSVWTIGGGGGRKCL